MSEPYRAPAPPQQEPAKKHMATWLLGGAGILVWLGFMAIIVSVVGFVALVVLYAAMHNPPRASPSTLADASASDSPAD
jgi:uncharacterized membrane protein YphA (DoxX/SURF4 family)